MLAKVPQTVTELFDEALVDVVDKDEEIEHSDVSSIKLLKLRFLNGTIEVGHSFLEVVPLVVVVDDDKEAKDDDDVDPVRIGLEGDDVVLFVVLSTGLFMIVIGKVRPKLYEFVGFMQLSSLNFIKANIYFI